MIGSSAAARAFGMAGLAPSDVDVAELYDVNSFEVVRQLEALGFCAQGEGAAFAAEVGIGIDGGLPVNTDGGLLSFSHIGWGAPTLKLIECVRQLRGDTGERQVRGAEVASRPVPAPARSITTWRCSVSPAGDRQPLRRWSLSGTGKPRCRVWRSGAPSSPWTRSISTANIRSTRRASMPGRSREPVAGEADRRGPPERPRRAPCLSAPRRTRVEPEVPAVTDGVCDLGEHLDRSRQPVELATP